MMMMVKTLLHQTILYMGRELERQSTDQPTGVGPSRRMRIRIKRMSLMSGNLQVI